METMDFSEMDFGTNLVCINHETMNVAFSTSVNTEEELEEVVGQTIKNCCTEMTLKGLGEHPTAFFDLFQAFEETCEQIKEEVKVTVIKPSLASLKDFVDALADTLEDGNMSHIKEYEDKYSKLPVQLKDYIWRKVNE